MSLPMLKKILPILIVFFFATGILLISLYQVTSFVRPSLAASSLKFYVSPPPQATSSSQATPSPEPKINYYLPYPGILPDNPFYKIKMLRDQVWLLLTSDPAKKAELLVLFANKRIGAGEVLIRGNKVSLGISTLIKGEKYFERAMAEVNKAKKKGVKVENVSAKLKSAPLKYEEVLTNLKESVSPEGRPALEDLLKLIRNLQEKASTL